MMTIGICEDEVWFARKLKKDTEEFLKEKQIQAEVFVCSRGEELFSCGSADILLMDIRLPGKNGMWIVRHLQSMGRNSQIIFITSYQDYVFEAFDMDAVHYLLKPVDVKKLYQALERAMSRISWEQGEEKLFTSTAKDGMVKIWFKDIVYAEVFNHQLLIYTLTQKYIIHDSLDALEKKLDGRFFRCHRSYLINMEFVTGVKDGCAVMAGQRQVDISRRKQQAFSLRLLESCRKRGM